MEREMFQAKTGKEQMKKKQDRLVSFFDAVVAVGITMIVMGISLPDAEMSALQLVRYIGSEITVYLVSFIALAELWRVHHAIFSYFDEVADEQIINTHIALMFVVTIFPFLTRFMNAYQKVNEIRILYISSYIIMNLLMIILVYLVNRKQVEKQIEQEENMKKWIPLILSQGKEKEPLRDTMREMGKYKALFGNQDPSASGKTNVFSFDEGMRESLRALGVLEEENPNEKKARSLQAMISISLNFISVTLSVILLMVNPYFCYIVFSVKFILDAVCKRLVEMFLLTAPDTAEGQKATTGQISMQERMEMLKKEQERREQERKKVAERMREEREKARKERENARKERENARKERENARKER